jgi:hypothetical protein
MKHKIRLVVIFLMLFTLIFTLVLGYHQSRRYSNPMVEGESLLDIIHRLDMNGISSQKDLDKLRRNPQLVKNCLVSWLNERPMTCESFFLKTICFFEPKYTHFVEYRGSNYFHSMAIIGVKVLAVENDTETLNALKKLHVFYSNSNYFILQDINTILKVNLSTSSENQ